MRTREYATNGGIEDCFDDPAYAPIVFTRDNLPPLDVLMVWHTFMLNPARFLEDCARQGKMAVWNSGMPWGAVSESIDSRSFAYEPGMKARELWEGRTRTFWDGLFDPPTRDVACVWCQAPTSVPWTTTGEALRVLGASGMDVGDIIDGEGLGFADGKLGYTCQRCWVVVNHDRLQVQKLLHDVKLLLRDDVPMSGTILSSLNRLESCHPKQGVAGDGDLFPNRLVKYGLDHSLLRLPTGPHDMPGSLQKVRDALQEALKDEGVVSAAINGKAKHISPHARRAVRVMMSRYWGNGSPFALDLTSAVMRQGVFIKKMHDIDWLHSPTLLATSRRLVTKYSRFFILLKDGEHMAVPTLDVDLVSTGI